MTPLSSNAQFLPNVCNQTNHWQWTIPTHRCTKTNNDSSLCSELHTILPSWEMWSTNCCSNDRLVNAGGSLQCPHSDGGKMWRKTEQWTIESIECTCVWATNFVYLVINFWLLIAVCIVKKLMSVSVFDRLVPNLVAVILFCTFILPWVGTGPLWNQVVGHNSDVCKNTWWRTLLFIHNYFGVENMVSVTATLLWWLLWI
jgi:hypothetical protein